MRNLVFVFTKALIGFFLVWNTANAATTTMPGTSSVGQDFDMAFIVVRSSAPGCEPRCAQWIQGKGKISWSSFKSLQLLLNRRDNRQLPVVIESRGGDMMAAMAIGRLIRKYNMVTAIGDTQVEQCPTNAKICALRTGLAIETDARCFSACPLILLGGVKRFVGPMPILGLHQPVTESRRYINRYWESWRYKKGRKVLKSRVLIDQVALPPKIISGMTASLRRQLLAYVNEMKASPLILSEMQKASPKTINIITFNNGDVERLGLATEHASFMAVTGQLDCSVDATASNCVSQK